MGGHNTGEGIIWREGHHLEGRASSLVEGLGLGSVYDTYLAGGTM